MGDSLANWFGWSTEQRAWFRTSAGVLWKIIPGHKPKSADNAKVFKDYITRRAKIYGMLPVKLFPKLRLSVDEDPSIEKLFTKLEAKQTSYPASVPSGFDWSNKPLIFITAFRGTALAALTYLEESSRFKPLAAGCDPQVRRQQIHVMP